MELVRNGYYALPSGKLAAVVTFLEMTEPPATRSAPERPDLELRRVERPAPDWYRDLYREIGSDWLWFSRLGEDDETLAATIGDPAVDVFALVQDGRDRGLLELDRRQAGEVELAFFGLTPDMLGGGAGRWLMNEAIAQAFAPGPTRFWLHTCSLDHPEALAFYMRSGFRPYRRAVEVCDDPRLTGALPRGAGERVPIIE